jgi:hypothetical protein
MIVPGAQAQQRPKIATDLKGSPAKIEMMPDPVRSEDIIRERAYEFYEGRGREPGHDEQDWLRAEKEFLTQEQALKSRR